MPEEVKSDKSVFMNQGEWELLGVLTQFREFMESSDCYAEMKFYVSRTGRGVVKWWVGLRGRHTQADVRRHLG